MLVELKRQLIDSIKSNDIPKRDILRLVVGEIELAPKVMTDEQIVSVIRKHINNNQEAAGFCSNLNGDEHIKLKYQSAVLETFLPITLSPDKIESAILDNSTSVFDDIQAAKNDGQAIGIAMKFFKSANLNVLGDDVRKVVTEIRSAIIKN